MLKHTQYVPVLRWKQAEWLALNGLTQDVKNRITPLIELLPKDFEPRTKIVTDPKGKKYKIQVPMNPDYILAYKVEEIYKHWKNAPFFLDLFHYGNQIRTSNNLHPYTILIPKMKLQGLKAIPVIGLNRSQDYLEMSKLASDSLSTGMCIRIHPQDFNASSFGKLLDLVSKIKIPFSQLDIIVDNQFLNQKPIHLSEIYKYLPNINNFRSFTFLSGAFPMDLTGFKEIGEHKHKRSDYLLWIDQIKKKSLLRKPLFGDYTIQHPFLNTNLPDFPNFSASIRYTAKDHWVIMRGRGVRSEKSSGYQQWPANAEMLCNCEEYSGKEFSQGDSYINNMRQSYDHPGNATTWLNASINHHLTFVVQQLSS